MYIVQRVGVYRQGIVGCAATMEEARRIAEEAIQAERDDHHDMEIVWCEVGRAYDFSGEEDRPNCRALQTLVRNDNGRKYLRLTGRMILAPLGLRWDINKPHDDTGIESIEDGIHAFAYQILARDPVAVDTAQDAMMGRRV